MPTVNARSTNKTLIAGFAVILAGMLVLVVLVYNHLNAMGAAKQENERLHIKTTAAFRMAESIRNRNFSLAVAPTFEDYFDRDDERERFKSYARDFLEQREIVLQVGLNTVEENALNKVLQRIREAQPIVEGSINDAVEYGSTPEVAAKITEAWKVQTATLRALDDFAQTVNQQAIELAGHEEIKMRRNLQLAVGLGGFLFAISLLTAIIVVRREGQSFKALLDASDEISVLNDRLKEENVRISSELDVAQKIQEMILPRDAELTAITELDVAAHMSPADEVGGDYYDVLQCCDGHVLVGIGDVTGHGLESGVIMLMVQSMVRALMETDEPDLRVSLATINQVIFRNSARMSSDKNLTLAIVHYFDGKIRIAGQHEEVLVVRQGNMERVDTIDLGFPIGLEENITPFIGEYSTHLDVGDVVVLYTDGITEAEDASGTLYGMERMIDIIQNSWDESSGTIRTRLIEDVNAFIGDGKVHDDVTLVVIKRC